MKENEDKQLAEAVSLAEQMTKERRREKEITAALSVADALKKGENVLPGR